MFLLEFDPSDYAHHDTYELAAFHRTVCILAILNVLFALKVNCFSCSIILERKEQWVIAIIITGSLAIGIYYLLLSVDYYAYSYDPDDPKWYNVFQIFGLLIQYIGIVLEVLLILPSLALETGSIRFLQWSTFVITIVSTTYSIFFVIIHIIGHPPIGDGTSDNLYGRNVQEFRMINTFYPFLFLVWMLFVCTIVLVKMWTANKKSAQQQQQTIRRKPKQMEILMLSILALGFVLQIIYYSFEADSVVYIENFNVGDSSWSKVYEKSDRAYDSKYPCFWIPQQLMIFFVLLSYNNLAKFRKEGEKQSAESSEISSNLQNNNSEIESPTMNSNNNNNADQTASAEVV